VAGCLHVHPSQTPELTIQVLNYGSTVYTCLFVLDSYLTLMRPSSSSFSRPDLMMWINFWVAGEAKSQPQQPDYL
jgi:hypothetical protein